MPIINHNGLAWLELTHRFVSGIIHIPIQSPTHQTSVEKRAAVKLDAIPLLNHREILEGNHSRHLDHVSLTSQSQYITTCLDTEELLHIICPCVASECFSESVSFIDNTW